jgi:uncharacterized protein
MAFYAVVYTYAENSTAARDEHRPAHREYFGKLAEEGVILLSGPFGPEEAPGALLILRTESAQEALAYTEPDPFVTEGLVSDISVREWIPVLGPLTEHL